MHLSTLCNRLNSAARFFPKSCFKSSSYANMQSWGAISVCLLAERPKVGGRKSTVLQRFHNTSKYNHNLATFSSLTQAQSRDQYPCLGKLATLIESVDYQNALVEFSKKEDINVPGIKDLLSAFVHKSYLIANHNRLQQLHSDNERLSVLGFQIMKQTITEYLLVKQPHLSAEETWDIQNALLDNHVPKVAWDLKLQRFMVFKNQPRFLMMSQTMFALIGVLHMHEGPERAAEFVRKRLIPELTTETVQHLVKLQHPKLLLKVFSEKQGTELPVTKILKGRESKSRFHLSQPYLYRVGVFRGSTLIAEGVSTSLNKAEKQACQKVLLDQYTEELSAFRLDLTNSQSEDDINFGLITDKQRVVEMFKESGESFGFKIKGGLKRKGKNEEWLVHWYYSPVFISYIEPGGLTERIGGLKVGDVIVAVNDRKIEGLDHARAVKTLTSVSGDVTLTVRHSPEVVIADAVETRYKKMKREKLLAELTSEIWGEWHQARADKNPSKYADVMEHPDSDIGTNGREKNQNEILLVDV